MYQMLTGALPYETPAPAEIDKLMTGELVSAPRLRNPKIPKAVNDVILRAMAPDIPSRYQRASELLDDVLAARSAPVRKPTRTPEPSPVELPSELHHRLRARDTPSARFCWHCRKPLHARTDRCPFCGESQ
jgi:hypothetical protein